MFKKILRGNSHELQSVYEKAAFTLAEVLITLGVAGVVAALTIPALINNIQNKVTNHKKKVIEARLIEGLNMLNIRENGLNANYNSSEDFVKALSKHMKLVQICGKDNLQSCFPYENITYSRDNGNIKRVKVSGLNTPDKLKLNGDSWLDPAGFITAGGVPFIISFNKDCSNQINNDGTTVIDPDRPIKDIPYQCIDGIYDLNGANSPNKMGSDVTTLHLARVSECIKELGDLCLITRAFTPGPVSYSDCETKYKGTLVNSCYNDPTYGPRNDDRWLGAKVACQNAGGHLPDDKELASLISMFYTSINGDGAHPVISSSQHTSINSSKYTLDYEYLENNYSLDPPGDQHTFMLWSSEGAGEFPHQFLFHQNGSYFYPGTGYQRGYQRGYSAIQGICLGD